MVSATFSVALEISSSLLRYTMSLNRSTSLALWNIHKDLTDNTKFVNKGNTCIASHDRHRRIQTDLEGGILVWAPKLVAQKGLWVYYFLSGIHGDK